MFSDCKYRSIFDCVASPVLTASPVYDEQHRITDFTIICVNLSFREFTGDLVRAGDRLSGVYSRISRTVDWFALGIRLVNGEKRISGSYYSCRLGRWLHITLNKITSDSCVITFADISGVKLCEKRLHHLVSRDSITGLPNRIHFSGTFNAVTAADGKKRCGLAVMLIDIDDMKAFSTVSGCAEGDRILKSAAAIFESFRSDTVSPFRMGDDEFLLLFTASDNENRIYRIADAVLKAFRTAGICISAGIARYPEDTAEVQNLVKCADIAVQSVKRSGEGGYAGFCREMYEEFLSHAALRKKIPEAVRNNVFSLNYQPQFNTETGKLRGFEAQLHWDDDSLGWVNPEKIITVAEETRTIVKLGWWILESAVETLKHWQLEFGFSGIMSVNVSPFLLERMEFVPDLYDLLQRYDIRSGSLELEIMESLFIDNLPLSAGTLHRIRKVGVLVSLDDFGTGYSSFKYLQMLPLTALKMDKAFISGLKSQDGMEADIAEAIISLALKMGLETIADGVEYPVQLDILKSMKCTTVQGGLPGRPMDLVRCEKLLEYREFAVCFPGVSGSP